MPTDRDNQQAAYLEPDKEQKLPAVDANEAVSRKIRAILDDFLKDFNTADEQQVCPAISKLLSEQELAELEKLFSTPGYVIPEDIKKRPVILNVCLESSDDYNPGLAQKNIKFFQKYGFQFGRPREIFLLTDDGAKRRRITELTAAVRTGQVELVRLLIKSGHTLFPDKFLHCDKFTFNDDLETNCRFVWNTQWNRKPYTKREILKNRNKNEIVSLLLQQSLAFDLPVTSPLPYMTPSVFNLYDTACKNKANYENKWNEAKAENYADSVIALILPLTKDLMARDEDKNLAILLLGQLRKLPANQKNDAEAVFQVLQNFRGQSTPLFFWLSSKLMQKFCANPIETAEQLSAAAEREEAAKSTDQKLDEFKKAMTQRIKIVFENPSPRADILFSEEELSYFQRLLDTPGFVLPDEVKKLPIILAICLDPNVTADKQLKRNFDFFMKGGFDPGATKRLTTEEYNFKNNFERVLTKSYVSTWTPLKAAAFTGKAVLIPDLLAAGNNGAEEEDEMNLSTLVYAIQRSSFRDNRCFHSKSSQDHNKINNRGKIIPLLLQQRLAFNLEVKSEVNDSKYIYSDHLKHNYGAGIERAYEHYLKAREEAEKYNQLWRGLESRDSSYADMIKEMVASYNTWRPGHWRTSVGDAKILLAELEKMPAAEKNNPKTVLELLNDFKSQPRGGSFMSNKNSRFGGLVLWLQAKLTAQVQRWEDPRQHQRQRQKVEVGQSLNR